MVPGPSSAVAVEPVRGGDPAGQGRTAGAARPSVEGVVQVAIMLAIGAAAGAASFTHVHAVAAEHGQAGWLAWADAVVLELMSVASGLEIRRRKRAHVSVAIPVVVLAVAVCLSLSAQVVDAEPSVIGWTAAAIPALGFLVMVKIALARSPSLTAAPVVVADAGQGDAAGDGPAGSVPALGGEDVALMPTVRALAAALEAQGQSVSRQALARALRAEGHAVSNVRVSAMLRELRAGTDGGGEQLGALDLAAGSGGHR